MVHTSTNAQQLGITVLRLNLASIWISHALLKLLLLALPGTAQYFASIGLAGWLAYPVFLLALLGGIALLLGIYARQAALALLPVMAVAAWVHLPNGWVHTSAGGGWEYPVFLIAASLALSFLGDSAGALKRSSLLLFAARGDSARREGLGLRAPRHSPRRPARLISQALAAG